jgi:hypothetical protein
VELYVIIVYYRAVADVFLRKIKWNAKQNRIIGLKASLFAVKCFKFSFYPHMKFIEIKIMEISIIIRFTNNQNYQIATNSASDKIILKIVPNEIFYH